MSNIEDANDLLSTPLTGLHIANQARMVPFAGYNMPVSYGPGVLKEHLHCRASAGLFDVSHMGRIDVTGEDIAQRLESLIPVDLIDLQPGRQKYGMLLNESGGILDDLMVMHREDGQWSLVVNAACKQDDLKLLSDALGTVLTFRMRDDCALLALQGPSAVAALQPLTTEDLAGMKFMDVADITINNHACLVSRSGYTGEDGFEISLPNSHAKEVAIALLDNPAVQLIGLGARDSLRMEAGLCLYGQDMDSNDTPIETGLKWAISPARRATGARAGGFPGAETVLAQIEDGARKTLTGLMPEGRAPMRPGTKLFDDAGKSVGTITSGGFSPSLGKPISIARMDTQSASAGNRIEAEVRGKRLPATTTKMPFVAHQYVR